MLCKVILLDLFAQVYELDVHVVCCLCRDIYIFYFNVNLLLVYGKSCTADTNLSCLYVKFNCQHVSLILFLNQTTLLLRDIVCIIRFWINQNSIGLVRSLFGNAFAVKVELNYILCVVMICFFPDQKSSYSFCRKKKLIPLFCTSCDIVVVLI